MEVDRLKLISGEPIHISEHLTLLQPTLDEIKNHGEQGFLQVCWSLCSSAWDMPSVFDDLGVDFMSVSDWDYFRTISVQYSQDQTQLILGDLDLSKFASIKVPNSDGTERIVMVETVTGEGNEVYIKPDGAIIEEEDYKVMITYLREMINFHHSGRKAGNKSTAKILIIEDRKDRKRRNNKPYESIFVNGIISLVNTEEFPYTYKTVFEITLYQFMKSLVQIQGKKSSVALMQGSMSGFVDTSKIPKEDMDWMYSEEKYKPKGKKLINHTYK